MDLIYQIIPWFLNKVNLTGYFSGNRFFLDFGTKNSLILILISLVCISILFFFSKVRFFFLKKFFLLYLLLSFLLSFYVSNIYLNAIINPDDLNIFYSPTTDKRIENLIALSFVYSITCSLASILFFYFFRKNYFLLFFINLLFITSPLNLWILYSSGIRDFLKLPSFIILILTFIYLIKEKEQISLKDLFLCTCLVVLTIPFRYEIIYFVFFFLFSYLLFYTRFFFIIRLRNFLIIFFSTITAYFFLSYNIYASNTEGYMSTFYIFLSGTSEDLTRLYTSENTIQSGPLSDAFRYVSKKNYFDDKNINYDFNYIIIDLLNFLFFAINISLKFTLTMLSDTNTFPKFLETKEFFKIISFLRKLLDFPIIYYISLLFIFFINIFNIRLLIFFFFTILFFSILFSVQLYHKNIFQFSIINYLLLFYSLNFIFRNIKNRIK